MGHYQFALSARGALRQASDERRAIPVKIVAFSLLLNLSVFGFGVFTHHMLTEGRQDVALVGLLVGSVLNVAISATAVASGRQEAKSVHRRVGCALHLIAAVALFDSIRSPAYPAFFRVICILVGIGLIFCGILLLLVPQSSEPEQSADATLSPEAPGAEQASCSPWCETSQRLKEMA